MIRQFQRLGVPTSFEIAVTDGDRSTTLQLPTDGTADAASDVAQALQTILDAAYNSYAPRRMLKLGHPASEAGVKIAAGSSILFRLKKELVVPLGAPIPFLVHREVQVGVKPLPTSVQASWKVTRLSVPADTNPHIEFRVISGSSVGGSIKNAYPFDIELRGAIYFPPTAAAVASRPTR